MAILKQHGRVSYRALKRQFDLDDAYLDDLKYELVDIHQVAIDQKGAMLVWSGKPEPGATLDSVSTETTCIPPLLENHTSPQSLSDSTGARRHATVLFSDLSGYTAMNERLDPEAVEALMGRIKDAAVDIVERHGGIVNQFVGDEVLALFGIPMAHEDDPLRAVRVALELHAMVRQISPEVEPHIGRPLQLHTGIHTGLIVTNRRDDRDGLYGITGDTVNTGARLKARANADDILISAEAQRLIVPYFETQPLEAVVLKGKAAPVVPYRVVGESPIHTRFEAAAQRGFTPYTGREPELKTLLDCFEAAKCGQGQFVTVMGEAGVGKSRLVYEFQHRLNAECLTVLKGNCQSDGRAMSYLPFLEVLGQAFDLRQTDVPEALREKVVARITSIDAALKPYLALYLHVLSIPIPDSLPDLLQGEELRYAVQEALAALLTLATQHQPAVVILEDWHWADEASRAALQHLVGLLSHYPLMVVATYRPSDTIDWSSLSYHTSMTLLPLNAWHTQSMSQSIIGASHLPPGLGELIHRRTGGNPLFIEEVCRSLSEEKILVVTGDQVHLTHDLDTLSLPDTVQAIVRTRLDRLEADSKEAVDLASVIGRGFSRRVLEQLYEGQTALPEVLDTLTTLEMIQQTRVLPETEYVFKHVLTQEVAYDTLLLQQRKTLHERVGEAIETLYPERLEEQVQRLHHHFGLAENWPKAVYYGRKTAAKALQLSQFDEAVAIFEQVKVWIMQLPDDPSRQELLIDVLLEQERPYEMLGQREQQQAIMDQLFQLLQPEGDPARLAETYARQGELYTELGCFDGAEQALGEALALRRALSDGPGESSTLRSMGFLRWHQKRYEEAVACNEAALAIDRQCGDVETIATDLRNLGNVWRNLGESERALDCLEEAQVLMEKKQNPLKQGSTLRLMATVYRKRGDLEEALAYYQRALALYVEEKGNLPGQTVILASIGSIYWEQGKTDESLRCYQEAAHIARDIRYTQGLSQTLRTLGELLRALNNPGEALTHLRESAESFAALGNQESEAEVWSEIAILCEQDLQDDRGAFTAWENVRALRAQLDDRRGVLEALQKMGRLAGLHLGEPHSAEQYLQEAFELAKAMDNRAKQGELLNSMGIISWQQADYENALTHYEQALQIYRELGEIAPTGLMLVVVK